MPIALNQTRSEAPRYIQIDPYIKIDPCIKIDPPRYIGIGIDPLARRKA